MGHYPCQSYTPTPQLTEALNPGYPLCSYFPSILRHRQLPSCYLPSHTYQAKILKAVSFCVIALGKLLRLPGGWLFVSSLSELALTSRRDLVPSLLRVSRPGLRVSISRWLTSVPGPTFGLGLSNFRHSPSFLHASFRPPKPSKFFGTCFGGLASGSRHSEDCCSHQPRIDATMLVGNITVLALTWRYNRPAGKETITLPLLEQAFDLIQRDS